MVGKKFYLIIFLLSIFISIFYYFKQPVASYHLEPRMDGNQYAKIYRFFKGEEKSYNVAFPYHSRVAIPYLAGLVPSVKIISAFLIINFLFILFTTFFLCRIWEKLQISYFLQAIGFGWLLLHWSGLIRLNIFDPLTVDVAVYFFETLLIYIIIEKKWMHLLWIGPVATLVKEQFPVFLILILGFAIWHHIVLNKRDYPILIILISLIISLISKEVINYYFPHIPINTGSSFHTIGKIFIITINHPARILIWIVSIFTAYGFFLIIILKGTFNKVDLIYLLSIASLGLSFWGGADFTRLSFLGFPFIMTVILQNLKHISKKNTLIILLFSIPFMRLFWQIPDPGIEWQSFTTWYPEYAKPNIVITRAVFILMTTLALFFYLKRNLLLNFKNS